MVDAISQDFAGLINGPLLVRALLRLGIATLLGGVLGYQRQRQGKAAGLRTHMLVTLGAALFVLISEGTGGTSADLSRVIQGVVTGIGFLGAGAILKLSQEREVHGLTTAAGIWMATAIGMAVGVGRLELAFPGAGLAILILSVIGEIEPRPKEGTCDEQAKLEPTPT